jgi:plastocyanin
MKTKLLLLTLIFFGIASINAQTTHDLNWQIGALSPTTDLTIEVNDTVRWTWTDASPHTVQNDTGSTETFNSGIITGNGLTYSYTFLLEGNNPYFCGIHGAPSMSGTITVDAPLSIEDFKNTITFNISPNPVTSTLNIRLSKNIIDGNVTIFDVLGKQILIQKINQNNLTQVNVSYLSRGMYIVKVSSSENTQTKRFIKE